MASDAERMADMLAAAIEVATAPLVARIAMLEQRAAKAFDVLTEKAPVLVGPPGPTGERGERGEPGANGTDGAEGRPGTDGKSVTIEDVAPLIASEVVKAVDSRPVPKDGVGLTGALIDRAGHLILTLSDGATKDIGNVVGRDVDVSEVERLIVAQLATWPKPADGKNGLDGLGFDDLSVVEDDGRQVLRFTRGDQVKDFKLHTLSDRGVYRPGNEYLKGDGVTWDGSFWIAQLDTTARPGGTELESRAWRLAVKKGAVGKPGEKGVDGINGTPGRHGRDLTSAIDPITGRRP